MHSVLKITALDINNVVIQSNILMANQFDIEIFPRIYLLKVKIGQLGYFVHIYLPLLISMHLSYSSMMLVQIFIFLSADPVKKE